ncbi:Transcription factor iws1 [Exophiala xenobiotica]|uniref:Transcription factor iws1 n=1 Tax=Lithohypha guttulata TaxID=1690604 RepID=A0ABR0KJL0_9EURO|nr:Transcription factor iws1 [Lithohypha guttulata]KAK5316325.1 Transcription factor iws1 [Exophiala xenobiotica]
MSDYDDIAHGSDMPAGPDMPPPDAEGLDRPDEVEDALDDTANDFNNDDADDADKLDKLDDDDDESLLSDVDEAVLDNFDENKLEIAPDFEQLRSTKIKKRKRDEGDEGRPKKKERTREKTRRRRGGSEGADAPEGDPGRRRRGGGGGGGERKPRERVEIDEDTLPPDERRRRALDRAMDAAVKKSSGIRKRKGEIDLEQAADEELNDLRNKMVSAAIADGELVKEGRPAYQKLKLLPEVVSVLNRNTYQQSILDPETNFLEPVRFFLEPLSDGSLPAYNIQRELFQALERLPMTKEALISSGIGKVVFFYRKSKRVDDKIKRQATKLMEEWSRPILQRSDDFTKKNWETVAFDPSRRPQAAAARPAVNVARKQGAALAPGQKVTNRARMLPGVTSYSIVPQVNSLPRR